MYPILFKIGPLTIYTYGVMVALALITGLYLAVSQAKKQGINPNDIINLFFWLAIPGFIGARIAYVFTEWGYFLKNPQRIFFAQEGFVFYGAFIGGFLGALWYVKKNKLETWKTADIFAPSIAIAHAIGRLGCFFYGCCYGRTKIPIQLISSFVLLVIFCILLIARKYKRFNGQIFWLYVFLYAIARFIIEFFRADPRGHIWFFSTSQFIAIFMAFAAILMLLRLRKAKQPPIRNTHFS